MLTSSQGASDKTERTEAHVAKFENRGGGVLPMYGH